MTLILQYWSGSQEVFLVPNPTLCFQLSRPYLLVFNFSKLLSVLVTLERVAGVAAAEVAPSPGHSYLLPAPSTRGSCCVPS